MQNFLDYCTKVIYLICTALFLGMTALLFIQSLLRYFIGFSIVWAEEVSLLCMVWIVFLGAVIATIKLSHSRITFFVNKLPLTLRRYITGIVSLLCAFINFTIAYYGIAIIKVSTLSYSTGLGYSLVLLYCSAPIACLLMGLIFSYQGFMQLVGRYRLEVGYGED